MEDFENELKLDFLDEANQLLESTEQAFLQLENDLQNKDLIDEIFRFAHNLKGTSRAVGFGVVAEFTHEVENLILKIKQDEIEINDHVVSILLECNDHISMMITDLQDDFSKTFDSAELISKVQQAIAGDAVIDNEEIDEEEVDDEAIAQEIEDMGDFEADDELINKELLAELEALEVPKENVIEVFEGSQNITNKTVPIEEKKTENKPKLNNDKKVEKDENIRVSLSRVETLNNFVGELVILQSVLEQQNLSEDKKDDLSVKSISQLGKLCKEIQEISMSLRMVPVKSTLQKMSRIVRDTSKALDKKVNLILKGENTEIDKTVLELLADPLVHIVRNAVDHGLESTQGRLDAGKSEAGNIIIDAYHEGNYLAIDVIDDGNGINADVIKQIAIDKKIINANSTISDDDVIQLIFHPGFSTKEQVSEVSGRGVGMDVVKTNIDKLTGDVRVSTQVGVGSTFKIVLPLTMAIIEGLVTSVGEDKFVVPINQVQESLKPQKDDIHFASGLGECLNLRGEVLPIKKVSSLLKLAKNDKSIEEQIIIIVKGKQGLIAVAVDDILQQQQVVIKKLGDEIKDQKGFMGSSILGDGKPVFIIDMEALCVSSQTKMKMPKAA